MLKAKFVINQRAVMVRGTHISSGRIVDKKRQQDGTYLYIFKHETGKAETCSDDVLYDNKVDALRVWELNCEKVGSRSKMF